jgi:hypothetical protein
VLVLGFRLAQLGFENEGVADRDGLPGKEAGNDLDGAIIFAAGGDLAAGVAGVDAIGGYGR